MNYEIAFWIAIVLLIAEIIVWVHLRYRAGHYDEQVKLLDEILTTLKKIEVEE